MEQKSNFDKWCDDFQNELQADIDNFQDGLQDLDIPDMTKLDIPDLTGIATDLEEMFNS